MRREGVGLCLGCLAFASSGTAFAQSTAPSSVTPPTLRPPAEHDDTAIIVPSTERLTPPPGSDGLSVTLRAVAVEGGFPELADETAAITAAVTRGRVTLAELYEAASAIEAAYARRGFVLARVTVPPQQLTAGGAFRIEVIDGFIESVDASAVPARVRSVVARRAAVLTGLRHLTLKQIEQSLLLAGDAPGLTLTSTLVRGTRPGGVSLLLSGRHRLVSGSLSADNNLAPSLGRYGMTAQVSLDSALGLGEQIYGFAVAGYNLPRAVRTNAPVGVLGGGVIMAPGNGRFSISPEVTFSRTQPAPEPGVPATRGRLRRLSLRGGFVLEKTRRHALVLSGAVEQIQESNDAVDFGVRLSLDRFVATRIGLSYSEALAGGGLSATVQLSQGLGGLEAKDLPSGANPSRQGARPAFAKGVASITLALRLPHEFQLNLFATGQTAFGAALFRSEQFALEGPDALSAYVGGRTAVDSAILGRAELGRAIAIGGSDRALRLSPYAFSATGKGWIARPTAVEAASFGALNVGCGLRGAIAGSGLGFALEYAHGLSADRRFNGADRLAFSTTIRF